MVFSSILFLWALFPVILVIYYLPLPRSKAEHRLKFQNFMLVVFSLFFYAWGGTEIYLSDAVFCAD